MNHNYVEKNLHPLATKNSGPHIIRKKPEHKKDTGEQNFHDERTAFQRDRDRILYSKAFRRLIHKTQVCFTGEMNENIRTRLTHTLEVAQIARSIARQLHLNEDLAEAIALGHDVGHTPFGHSGEKVLSDILDGTDQKIKIDFGLKPEVIKIGFKHNFQSVRVLMKLEEGYGDAAGLNLTYPVLEGILKHTKLYTKNAKDKKPVYYFEIVNDSRLYIEQPFSATMEGQIVALADEIAQKCHDVEDAIVGDFDSKKIIRGYLEAMVNDGFLKGIEKQECIVLENGKYYIKMDHIKEFTSWVIGKIILDSVEEISKKMKRYMEGKSKDRIVTDWCPITEEIATDKVLEGNFVFEKLIEIQRHFVINNQKIDRENGKSRFILRRIIKAYLTNPRQLDDSVLKKYSKICEIKGLKKEIEKMNVKTKNIRYLDGKIFDSYKDEIIQDNHFQRILCDYVSSMTDVFAVSEYQKLYSGDRIGE
jgi:dGTPase